MISKPARTTAHVGWTLVVFAALTLVWASASAVRADSHEVSCGDVISEDTTLTQDLGPCPGHGLILEGENITLDLGGHTIAGDPDARSDGELMQGSRDRAGVLIRQSDDASVLNGTVEHFDAGVAIMGGTGNRVASLILRDNVNYRVTTGDDADPGEETPSCLFGEGIAVFNSSANSLEDNLIVNNGPFSGIALVGDADGNHLLANEIRDSDVENVTPDGRLTVCGTGEEQGPMTRGRRVQGMGVRVEGPGAQDNLVEANAVHRAAIIGIAVHGYHCDQGINNGNNQILGNTVWETGQRTHELDSIADGIAIMLQGPAGTICVSHSNTIEGNVARDNFRDGIFMAGRGSHSNVVNDNTVDDNARHGLHVAGPADGLPGSIENTLHGNAGSGNAGYDGADFNPECDDNDWQDGDFGEVNQPCVGQSQELDPGTVMGTVTDSDSGEGIADAEVTAIDADGAETAGTTDEGGQYTLTDLPPGDYTVAVTADGYTTAAQDATVQSGATTTVDFALEATSEPDEQGTIAGHVRDAQSDAAIADAEVVAVDAESAETAGTTDAEGAYAIEELAAGDYTVTATADGYTQASQTAVVEAGQTTTVDFTLEQSAPEEVECGDVITQDTTLTRDLGPCPSEGLGPLAGLTIAADDITLDLGGHTITGDPDGRPDLEMSTGMLGSKDQPAIRLDGVSGVTVQNGTVEHFDAGVEIMFGSGNTVRDLVVRDNINYRIETGADAAPDSATPVCRLGEGVSVFNSVENVIEDNTVVGNGPFGGIILKGRWPSRTPPEGNVIRDNVVRYADVPNTTPEGEVTVCGTGEQAGPAQRGRAVEGIGISLEGPGAQGNVVEGNEVERAALAGIGIHGHPCDEASNNGANHIVGNTVASTGETTHTEEPAADGIALLAQEPAESVCSAHANTIEGNVARDNFRDGIFMAGRGSHSNVVNDNTVDDNARHGLHVAGPADGLPGSIENTLHGNAGSGNAGYDGADFNPECDDNNWQDSELATANRPCVLGLEGPAAIIGVVTDAQSGQPLSDAEVVAVDAEGGETATRTGEDGRYVLEGLASGDYAVTGDAEGYELATYPDVALSADQLITVDLALEPGAADPAERADCMDDGWRDYGFRNQGQCIRFVKTGRDSR